MTYLRADPQGTARRTDGTARWYWLLPVVLGSWSTTLAWLGLMS
ncbi:MAG TPA: hypothetical protein VNU66_02570 [Mycobacteriales bacterium]|nr:hypothetical protein [Mycobacteriales bacterium]